MSAHFWKSILPSWSVIFEAGEVNCSFTCPSKSALIKFLMITTIVNLFLISPVLTPLYFLGNLSLSTGINLSKK